MDKVEKKRSYLLTWMAILLVLFIYVWFTNLTVWRSRGVTSDYYSRIATSFRHGQLALEENPDPALLALSNPYDHKARKNIHVVGDASLYKGKYYLYFGPFPSLPLAVLASILPVQPGDQFFVYLFIVGLFLIHCLLFWEILRIFFPGSQVWVMPLGVLILGLTGPYTRMIAHPFIHEAAIAGGQLLFMVGFYFTLLALKQKPVHRGRLVLAGTFWAFSIATRFTELPQVGFMVVLTWLYIFYEYRTGTDREQLGKSTCALIAPLLVCGGLMAWYNWARFDSIFEFGLFYQLAAFNLQANYSILFSRVYFFQNIYNYFFNAFAVARTPPFFFPRSGTEMTVLSSIHLPNLYAVEGKFPGILASTPFLILAIIPMFILIKELYEKMLKKTNGHFNLSDWAILGLFGSFIASCLMVLLFFYVGLRYETEFISSLTLLALIGFCQGYMVVKTNSARKLFSVIGVSLALFSIFANLALAYTGVTIL
jgi:hypothetical protein